MLGRTHITAGVATALLVLHPTTALEIGAAVAGGALGGAICDIDCKGTDRNKDTFHGAILAALCIAAVAFFDYRTGNGLVAHIRNAVGTDLLIGCLGMLACCIWGCISPHRTFTHSVLGLLAMSTSVWLVCAPLGYGLGIGMASHILLDLLNRRGIPLLYPLRHPSVCLDLCDSDGLVNRLLSVLFTVACAVLLFCYVIPADIRQSVLGWIKQTAGSLR